MDRDYHGRGFSRFNTPRSVKTLWVLVILSFSALTAFAAYSQTATPGDNQLTLLPLKIHSASPEQIGVGDSVNLYTGGLAINQKDVQIPGLGPAVEIGRIYHGHQDVDFIPVNNDFGDWSLDIPRVETNVPTVPWPGNICSAFDQIMWYRQEPIASLYPGQVDGELTQGFWFEYQGTRRSIVRAGNPNLPAGTIAATSDFWVFSCGSLANSTGEGFIARGPDGTTIQFDQIFFRRAPTVFYAKRNRVSFLPSRITDRFGNYVTIQYTALGQVKQIDGSDGRSVVFGHTIYEGRYDGIVQPHEVITQATANGKTWTYSYASSTRWHNAPTMHLHWELTSVTRPDGSQWRFSYTPFPNSWIQSYSITTPYGQRITYSFEPEFINTVTPSGGYMPRGNIPSVPICLSTQYRGICFNAGAPSFVAAFGGARTVNRKQISGPGLITQTWTYSGYLFTGAPGEPRGWYSAHTPASTQKTISVTSPNSTIDKYTYSILFDWTEGQLLQHATYPAGWSTPIQVTTYSYQQGASVGSTGLSGQNSASLSQTPVYSSIVRQQDGDIYSTLYQSYDAFNNPRTIVRSNGAGGSVTESISYHNNTSSWVLGKVSEHLKDAKPFVRYTFTPQDQIQEDYRFGLRQFTYQYEAPTGALASLTNGLGYITFYGDYFRGIPRLITVPTNHTFTAGINGDGTIASATDGRGSTTSYGYDSLGRLTRTTYPSGDSVTWTDSTHEYTALTSVELGMPVGLWRQRNVHGNYQTSAYHDALLRPILIEEKDTATGQAIYIRKTYDHEGRLTFQSYPSSNSTASSGIFTFYDALGRPTGRQTTDGVVLEQLAYLSGNRRRITDADNRVTTISYQAFDAPDYSRAVRIESEENQITVLARDVFGNILSITQSGTWPGGTASASRSFEYDAYLRPCRRHDPESGSTAWGYDAASQIAWEAKGQSGSGCLSAAPSGATTFQYDRNGRKILDDHPGSSDDVTYGYDGAGNLVLSSNATASWSYTYNKRNLLETEQVSVDGKILLLDPGYNSQGWLATLNTPAQTLSYAPDAWGRPTQLGGYAAAIQYHPNGVPKEYTLGNGLIHRMVLNNRLWPQYQMVLDGGNAIQYLSYTYSNYGDLLYMDDLFDDSEDMTANYDGLHRLKDAAGLWGGYIYTYDTLNNIRSRTGVGSLTYNYSNNRLVGISGTQTRSYSYNDRGEIVADGSRAFTLNARGQITNIAGLASYGYDGNGRRIKTDKSGAIEYTLYNRMGDLVYTEQGAQKTDYLKLNGQSIVELNQVNGITAPTYLHPDLLGSPRSATTVTRSFLWREHYDPYGQKLNGVNQKIGYTGHAYDPETGYTYMQARFYDPLVGRFLSTDPVYFTNDNPFTFNRYSYANNNPYRHIDPDGRAVDTLIDAGYTIYDTGRFLGASAAAVIGSITGNDSLKQAGLEGMGETGTDLAASAAAILVPAAPAPVTRSAARYSRATYKFNSKSNSAKAIREAAEGQPCPKCGTEMKSGTKHAPQVQHEPTLSEFHYEKGGAEMTDLQKKDYANSAEAVSGANCAQCQKSEGGRQRQYVERKERERNK